MCSTNSSLSASLHTLVEQSLSFPICVHPSAWDVKAQNCLTLMYQGFYGVFPLLRPCRITRDLNRHFAVKQFNSRIMRIGENGRVCLGVRDGRYCPAWTGGILKTERENSKAANPCGQPRYGKRILLVC